MNPKLIRIPLGKITYDPELYPRDSVSQENVHAIQRALEAGVKMPPIAVDAKTFLELDGEHRRRGYIANGMQPEEELEVEAVPCANRREMFLEAIRRNAKHGKRLTSYDVATVAVRATTFKLSREECADALSMTVDAFESLTLDRVAFEKGGKKGRSKSPILLKRTLKHLAGEELTKAESASNKTLSGMQQRFYVRQVLALLVTPRLIKWDDSELLADIVRLRDLLGEALAQRKAG